MNPIPPQAYTKDSLLKAYAWLQNQDPSLKEMATTPDILVSLYLKATRDGDAALDRPSIQNFKHELKQLAGLMGEFEKEGTPAVAAKSADALNIQGPPKRESPQKVAEALTLDFQALEKKYNSGLTTHVNTQPSQAVSSMSGSLELDSTSIALINEVRLKLNLTTNQEALKMLIQVGYNKTKKLL
tara:strand:+ start:52598 stop:53152 length:555 start_codon:yes stop_codon:yes gene_type:complete